MKDNRDTVTMSRLKEVALARHPRRAVIYLLLGLLLVGGLGFGLGSRWHPGVEPAQAAQTVSPAVQSLEAAFVGVAKEVTPAVVHIRVETQPKPSEEEDFFAPFRPFMPQVPRRRPMPRQGTGSGVIIDSAGYVLTNVHVVSEAARITVVTAGEQEYKGEVVGTDPETDLAIVNIDSDEPLASARLGNADNSEVGSFVMAIGSPFGLEATVTTGVISAKGRTLRRRESPYSPFRDLLQTDASINQGNSGGPLVNLKGEVIGINQAIMSPGPGTGNVGIGFAIPINSQTQAIIAALKRGESFVRGRLGVYLRDMERGLAEIYGVKQGAFVEQVIPDTPASEAGIQEEDIIIGYDGQPIETSDQLVSAVQRTRPGTEVTIRLIRDNKEKRVVVAIGKKTKEVTAAKTGPEEPTKGRLGLWVSELTPETASSLGVEPDTKGVVVKNMDPVGDAARAGIRPGDIIVKVNLTPVRNLKDYTRAVAKLKVGRPATVRYHRGDQIRTAVIEEVTE
ncbi:MAG: PDZ domain-containing protein [Armatimonadetes bacterium]|nr:PDZ domain-containing protein [Armatimonadota bacterium]NIM23414.1 PDZ domain-containing protein [Armatimonadota bacterium]NIM67279.1 PDZ domain-containing protein [Armatimonadota bacterium]NIM75777.1 PDZ domain-containing protein [Armatimonadota bacterium]NIN05465.1 PDZ domain-containing protein [Armatimonadota bacterium]